MIKELHLVARVIYTAIITLFFSSITGLSFTTSFMGIGWIVFGMSFLFQHYVIHFTLKQVVTVPRRRLYILIGWFVVSMAGMLVAGYMTPSLKEWFMYESDKEFLRTMALWGSIYATFGSNLVAVSCARRAFSQHGSLG